MSEKAPVDLYSDPHLAQFYDLSNSERADFTYCRELAKTANSVLDLGCGTGTLAASLAQHHQVTGVDPARAMLEVARQRRDGDKVHWVEADARQLSLEQRFDLILLTGHSFQVFLTDDDQLAVLGTIERHLKPGGRFIFDTRNPDFDAPKTRERAETIRHINHPQMGKIEAWNHSTYDAEAGILSYENGYKTIATGETHIGAAQIRYTSVEDIAIKLSASGLAAERWLGEWDGTPFKSDSREIIPLGGLA